MTGVSLGQFAAELHHAAGEGVTSLASSVVAAGNVLAKTNIAGPEMPGPGLRAVVATQTGHVQQVSNTSEPSRIPAIAARMGQQLVDGGAALLSGKT